VKSIGKRKIRLANSQVIERDVRVIGIEVQGIKTHTLAVFEDQDTYLLGATTLEELGLEVDPVRRELRPMELLLMLKQAQ
jgi:predicted aspartyl protease